MKIPPTPTANTIPEPWAILDDEGIIVGTGATIEAARSCALDTLVWDIGWIREIIEGFSSYRITPALEKLVDVRGGEVPYVRRQNRTANGVIDILDVQESERTT